MGFGKNKHKSNNKFENESKSEPENKPVESISNEISDILSDSLKEICELFKCSLKQHKDLSGTIWHIDFTDGRKYQLQIPTFMELHNAIYDSGKVDTGMFILGLKNLFPKSPNSPTIDEKFLNVNRSEGILWSRLIRGLLYPDWNRHTTTQ